MSSHQPSQSGLDSPLSACAGRLSSEAYENVRRWLESELFAEFHDAIRARIAAGEFTSLEDEFYTELPFGTGGRRGPRGIGPNRINRRTMAESARGLVNWVLASVPAETASVVIAHDTRHGSTEFSRVCAQAIAAAGVRAYLFDGFRPTPELSFAVRYLGASAGIVVSASHNPPTDNGFKAYGPDGGQLVPPDDSAVMEHVQSASAGAIPLADFDESVRSGRILLVGAEIDDAYLTGLAGVCVGTSRAVRIVFTPLHGVGALSVLPGLERAGFTDIHVVESQNRPDGDFPCVENSIPNPEVPSAMTAAREICEKLNADAGLATDPDADRLGCVARRVVNGASEWAPLNGNQIGALLCHHVLSQLALQGRLRPDALVVKTAVTSDLVERIAMRFGAGVIGELLVGFKYIANVLKHLDDPNRLVFASEESHGYLSKPYTRDKDGANAALLLSEAAAAARAEGTDLWRRLREIYREFGYFKEHLENYVRPGKSGQAEIMRMLDGLRAAPPTTLAGIPVISMVDRLNNLVTDPATGAVAPFQPIRDPATGRVFDQLMLATDNLLIFELGAGRDIESGKVAVRPSGTEPKCKFYVSVNRRISGDDRAFESAAALVDSAALALRDAIVEATLALA